MPNLSSNILDNVVANRPLDYQLPLFYNYFCRECPVIKNYRNFSTVVIGQTFISEHRRYTNDTVNISLDNLIFGDIFGHIQDSYRIGPMYRAL